VEKAPRAGDLALEPRKVVRPKRVSPPETTPQGALDDQAAAEALPIKKQEQKQNQERDLNVNLSSGNPEPEDRSQRVKVQMPPLPPGISNRSSFTKASQVRIQQRKGAPDARVEDAREEPVTRVRRVIPRQTPEKEEGAPLQQISRLRQREADFLKVAGAASDGIVARMREDGLEILVWYRPDDMPSWIYGAKLNLQALRDRLAREVYVDDDLRADLVLALLDQRGEPVALSQPDFTADWRRPFVAAEIGEVLPFWEAAVYQVDPERLRNSAEVLRYSLGALVLLLVGVIGLGSGFIARDLNRQVRAARQKTDFVSNVSHELKTPLTSIRMFSELLSEGRVKDAGKQKNYLDIIVSEASRLTRLINNVLDFANMERGEKSYQFEQVDLVTLIRENVEMLEPSLAGQGMALTLKLPEEQLPIRADADALARVVVNLLSNCEKYAAAGKDVTVSLERQGGSACLTVEDRGPGVPRGLEQKIFEQFFRADESLSSGKQGSGLGLTLARQIVRAHHGSMRYEPRRGGGSRFVVQLPLADAEAAEGSAEVLSKKS
jgi:signal transduction histidine kinase